MIDASIPLQVKPVALADPVAQYGNVMAIQNAMNQNRLADLQYKQLQTAQSDEEAVKNAFTQAGGDLTGARNALMQKGLYKPALALDEAERKRRMEAANITEKDIKAAKDKLDITSTLIAPLVNKPDLTHEDVVGVAKRLEQMGVLPAGWERTIPLNTLELPNFVRTKAMETAAGAKQLEALMPKAHFADVGNAVVPLNQNPLAGPVGAPVGAATAKAISPGQQLTADTTMRGQDLSANTALRGQDLTRQTAMEAAARAGQHYDPERGIVVNTQSNTAAPVVGPAGVPIGEKEKPLTDSQAKSLLFGARMQEANGIFDQLQKSGTDTAIPGARLPGVGPVITAIAPENQQKLLQAQRDFLNAVLRRESGAVISPSEFSEGNKQYFPQVGDSAAVIEQKRKNRETAMRGVLVEVPEKQRAKLVGEVTGTSSAKTITRADAQALATKTGKTVDEILAVAKQKGYTLK
jgi:hypothetical protein